MSEVFSPEQQKMQWCEQIKKENDSRNKKFKALETPYGTWLDKKEMAKDISYFNNYKKHEPYSEYDRLFHLKHGYEMKLHRDDRGNRVGLNVYEEEKKKVVPILTSFTYGSRPPLEIQQRQHVIIESVNKGFFRSRGTNIPCGSTE